MTRFCDPLGISRESVQHVVFRAEHVSTWRDLIEYVVLYLCGYTGQGRHYGVTQRTGTLVERRS